MNEQNNAKVSEKGFGDQTTVLDCTLRDGGYYVNWHFSEALINEYLRVANLLSIDFVELGLRLYYPKEAHGCCATTTDDFIASLNVPSGLKLGVMINAADLIEANQLMHSRIETLFPRDASQTRISLVRIACHKHEVLNVLPITAWLKNAGFSVGLNLMQVSEYDSKDFENIKQALTDWPIDVLYFADSLGCLQPNDVEWIINECLKTNVANIGIHAHDNLRLAHENARVAIDAGATWVDSTITGMGRGPGNARTEELLPMLAKNQDEALNLVPLMQLISNYFKPLQKDHQWGTNTYYYLSGLYRIHPSYVQQMLQDKHYDEARILAVIDYLKNDEAKIFDMSTLTQAKNFYVGKTGGSWAPKTVFEGKSILILGSGPSIQDHYDDILSYVKTHKPIVMALNTQVGRINNLVDYYIACHPLRLMADLDIHFHCPQPLIMPQQAVISGHQQKFKDKKVLDFGLSVAKSGFIFNDQSCVVPCYLAIAYALSVATSGCARKIILAGFDGYQQHDPRNGEMNELIQSYQQHPEAIMLHSITPTSYDVGVVQGIPMEDS